MKKGVQMVLLREECTRGMVQWRSDVAEKESVQIKLEREEYA